MTSPIVLDTYTSVHAALANRDLARTADEGSYEDGNIREGSLNVLHGTEHRNRRRVENPLFRRDRLTLYERELFPRLVDDLLPHLVEGGRADLFDAGHLMGVVLSARTAGIDHGKDVDVLRRLTGYVHVFAQGVSIEDTIGDVDAVRAEVAAAHRDFDREFLAASMARRRQLLRDGAALPADVLSALLVAQDAAGEQQHLDDGRILREVALYLEAGVHTSAQTLMNVCFYLFPWFSGQPHERALLLGDRLRIQRVVHEALRLRPTNPRIRRYALRDTEVEGRSIAAGSEVVLDTHAANRDPSVYGPTADEFDPDRIVGTAPRWGFSFGAGMHACIGRSLAVGLPVADPPAREGDDDHLYGLVTTMVEAVLARGVRPDPDHEPEPDRRTRRWTRWLHFPVHMSPDADRVHADQVHA